MSINGKQSVKLEKGIIKFENYFQQIPVPFKIYADFECNLKSVKCNEGSYTKNVKITFLVVLPIKLFVFMIDLLSHLLFIEVKMQLMNLLKQFLRKINIAEKIMNKYFNKNLKKKNIYFKKVILVGFVKNLLTMMKKK